MKFRYSSVQVVSNLFLRLSVGLPMILIGISEYRDFAPFSANVTDGLGSLQMFGTVWAFLLPGLLILGGGMLIVGRYSFVAAWVGGIALGSIPAGLLLKTVMTGLPLPAMLREVSPVMIWIIAFYFALNAEPDFEEMAAQESS